MHERRWGAVVHRSLVYTWCAKAGKGSVFEVHPPATHRILALLNDGSTYIHTYIYMIQTIYYYSEPVYTVY
jgi:hypothetical protein